MKLTKQPLKEIYERMFGTLNEARKYKLGDGWSNDFDYEGMLKMGTKSKVSDGEKKLGKLASSFTDVNYHTVAQPLMDAWHFLKIQGDKKLAASHLKKFNKLCKDELKIDKLYGKFS